MGNPKILNLDELELEESAISIVHEGEKHAMSVLNVDMFIKQQRRQREQEKKIAESDSDELAFVDAVELMRDSIHDFFPTLDVGSLETPKLFRIFAFLNEVTAQANADSAGDVVDQTGGDEGNEPKEGKTES